MTGNYRIWIPGYADLAQSLFQALREVPKYFQIFSERDYDTTDDFHQLKRALTRAPALSLPTQDKFQLYVCEKKGLALGVVTQY
jgi:hypothetical protein